MLEQPAVALDAGHLRIVCAATYEGMSRAAAAHMASQLRLKPDSTLILAAGGSPARAYELLAAEGQRDPALCDRASFVKLDEWGGLEMDDPATCEAFLRRVLIDPLGIPPERFIGFHSNPADGPAECVRIERLIQNHGPAQLCVLGLGVNGHIGFNEPGAMLHTRPHQATLSGESLAHNMALLARRVPGYGLTLGLRDILLSNAVMLLVSGSRKRTQLARLLESEISTQFPASALNLHPNVTIYCDEEAYPPKLKGRHKAPSPC